MGEEEKSPNTIPPNAHPHFHSLITTDAEVMIGLQGVLASGDGGAVMGKDIKGLAIENSSFEGNAVSDSVGPRSPHHTCL